MARRTLTDKGVAALKPRARLYPKADPQLPGHYIRVMPSGSKSFVCTARTPGGKQVWHTIGSSLILTIDEARTKARAIMAAVKAGKRPGALRASPASPNSGSSAMSRPRASYRRRDAPLSG